MSSKGRKRSTPGSKRLKSTIIMLNDWKFLEALRLKVQGEYMRRIRYHLPDPLPATCITENILLYMNHAGAVAEGC